MSTYNYNPYGGNPIYPGNSAYLGGGVNPQLGFNGRLVENIEMAKMAEVPLGSYGIFPKTDMSEIYIKAWNNNGTTNMLTYKLVEGQPETQNNDISQLEKQLQILNDKIDSLVNNGKKVRANDY